MSTETPAVVEPEAEPSTAVAVVPVDPTKTTLAVLDWDDAYRELVKRTVLKPKDREATNVELYFFAEQVKRTGLDPFHRQIYGIFRKSQGKEELTVQVGIDGFRLVAERTGKYEGQTEQEWCGPDGIWHTVWTQDGHPFAARCGVYKRGRRQPTYAVAHWSEYVQTFNGQPTGKWKTTDKGGMPANQLSKCAEALALRKCFPAELSGLYTPEEMEQADDRRDLTADDETLALDVPLPSAVEEIITRARSLGHAGLANRAAAAMAVTDQPEAAVAKWCRDATAVLNRVAAGKPEPEDAVVVDPEEAAAQATEVDDAIHAVHNGLLLCGSGRGGRRAVPVTDFPATDEGGSYCWGCLAARDAISGDLSPQPPQTANPPSDPQTSSEAPAAPPEPGESAKATPTGADSERITALARREEQLLADQAELSPEDPRHAEIDAERTKIADEITQLLEGPGEGQATLL